MRGRFGDALCVSKKRITRITETSRPTHQRIGGASVDYISMLDKVLQNDARITSRITTCGKSDATPPHQGVVENLWKTQLNEWVRSMVLLEAQTNVQIPPDLEQRLNTAVMAGDLAAGYEATRAIRDRLVGSEVAP